MRYLLHLTVRPNGRKLVSANLINEAWDVPIKISWLPSVRRTAINSSSSLNPIAILPFLLICEKLLKSRTFHNTILVANTK